MLRSGSQAGEFYNEGRERLVSRLDKCLNNGGDYARNDSGIQVSQHSEDVHGFQNMWKEEMLIVTADVYLNSNSIRDVFTPLSPIQISLRKAKQPAGPSPRRGAAVAAAHFRVSLTFPQRFTSRWTRGQSTVPVTAPPRRIFSSLRPVLAKEMSSTHGCRLPFITAPHKVQFIEKCYLLIPRFSPLLWTTLKREPLEIISVMWSQRVCVLKLKHTPQETKQKRQDHQQPVLMMANNRPKHVNKKMGGVIVGGRINCIRFADDMTLLAEEETVLRDMLVKLNDSCEQYGMKINANKTEEK
ncbi:hypothetical protein ANN_21589 [Periplaneta americana]|uniref:Reverse transcriptase domain-containing protein n=1 Tax=Periplaneta americana TaxID=6978 RepID=A0ABQ8S6N3_PERAM|nr:hypothetical protein ANN_21589 [Periplaneta americana]